MRVWCTVLQSHISFTERRLQRRSRRRRLKDDWTEGKKAKLSEPGRHFVNWKGAITGSMQSMRSQFLAYSKLIEGTFDSSRVLSEEYINFCVRSISPPRVLGWRPRDVDVAVKSLCSIHNHVKHVRTYFSHQTRKRMWTPFSPNFRHVKNPVHQGQPLFNPFTAMMSFENDT